jgi:hypothetical protein
MKELLAFMILFANVMPTGSARAADTALQLALKEERRPTITRATDVVTEASPKQVNAGDDVVFSVRVGAEGLLRDGFQVRIFTLPELSASPVEASAAVDDCLTYFSTVYPIAGTASPRVHLISNASEGWLSMSDGKVGNGYFLLVFEKTGVTESVFRIKRSDADAYFATGIRLLVKAGTKARLQEVINQNELREKARRSDAAKLVKTSDSVPCYRYEKVTRFAGLAEAPVQYAMLSCAENASAG